MNAFLDIDFEDGDQSTYRGIEISLNHTLLKRFDSGDITIDFIDYMHYIDSDDEIVSVAYLSSWDHFFMDGDKYRTMYVDHKDGNKVITDFSKIPLINMNRLMQYPVTEDITTFEQLKKYYFSKRPKNEKTN